MLGIKAINNNNSLYNSDFGYLYNRQVVVTHVNKQLVGSELGDFHIPTLNDWKLLFQTIGNTLNDINNNDIYTNVKTLLDTSDSYWYTDDIGTNYYGLTLKGNGYRNSGATYSGRYGYGSWWIYDQNVAPFVEYITSSKNFQFNGPNDNSGRVIRLVKTDVPIETSLYNVYAYDYNENRYSLKRIGTQVWIVEDLRAKNFMDGTVIYNKPNTTDWINSGSINSYCLYNQPIDDYAVITTRQVYNINYTNAYSGGDILNNGGTTITEKGICYKKKDYGSYPTTGNTYLPNGSGNDGYNSYLPSLNPAATYWVRSYCKNNKGTSYGNLKEFNTLSSPPTIVITKSNLQKFKVTIDVELTNYENIGTIISRSIQYVKDPSYFTNNINILSYTYIGVSEFNYSIEIDGLLQAKPYSFRAIISTELNTYYSDILTFNMDHVAIGSYYNGGIVVGINSEHFNKTDYSIYSIYSYTYTWSVLVGKYFYESDGAKFRFCPNSNLGGDFRMPYIFPENDTIFDRNGGFGYQLIFGNNFYVKGILYPNINLWNISIGTGKILTETLNQKYGTGKYAGGYVKNHNNNNYNGYNDWFVPNIGEMNVIYSNKSIIDNINPSYVGNNNYATINLEEVVYFFQTKKNFHVVYYMYNGGYNRFDVDENVFHLMMCRYSQ